MPKTLLIADDAPIIRRMIRDTAQEHGWEVVAEAGNGHEAAQQFDEHRPDAMTLDLVMPEYDGLFALREIFSRHPRAKVVVVSALNQKPVLAEALQLGASDFVVKPFDRGRLAQTLEQLLA